MASRKGFTLIEPMVAIFIVGVLAAETIPIMRGRIDSAKWSEAKARRWAVSALPPVPMKLRKACLIAMQGRL